MGDGIQFLDSSFSRIMSWKVSSLMDRYALA